MNLHSDKEAFKEIIALAAEHFGYEQSHVEKDYWVSKILRDISMSEYADKTYFKGGTSLSKAYGLESFETQCINPRKTICDKVSRLVKLSYNEDAAALLAKHIRDVYDLSALYHNQEYNDYLHSEDFLDAMYRVTIEDGLNKNSRSHLSLADAPIFKDAEAVMALPEVATAYTTDLKKLTFDKSKMPPIGKAVEALKNLHEILVRFEAYRTKKQNEEQP